MFRSMVRSWFDNSSSDYNDFIKALLPGDVEAMNLTDRYVITSNRESGFGRYDVMLEPRETSRDDAMILEFKVQGKKEKELSDTVSAALQQIKEKDYQASLVAKGVSREHIRKYGFAFCGKEVLIGTEKE